MKREELKFGIRGALVGGFVRIVVYQTHACQRMTTGNKFSWNKGIIEGENPVHVYPELGAAYDMCSTSRVVWDCSLKVGGKFHLKLNTGERPIANKYREER